MDLDGVAFDFLIPSIKAFFHFFLPLGRAYVRKQVYQDGEFPSCQLQAQIVEESSVS